MIFKKQKRGEINDEHNVQSFIDIFHEYGKQIMILFPSKLQKRSTINSVDLQRFQGQRRWESWYWHSWNQDV